MNFKLILLTHHLVHTIKTMDANVHDATVTPGLLTGEENFVYGDSGYLGANKRENVVIRETSHNSKQNAPW